MRVKCDLKVLVWVRKSVCLLVMIYMSALQGEEWRMAFSQIPPHPCHSMLPSCWADPQPRLILRSLFKNHNNTIMPDRTLQKCKKNSRRRKEKMWEEKELITYLKISCPTDRFPEKEISLWSVVFNAQIVPHCIQALDGCDYFYWKW